MLNKLSTFIKQHRMVQPGDTVICAVSGGADSVALLFALYLLKEKLGISLEAAHFNHHLRGAESDRDEAFVKEFCDRYDIPLHLDGGEVKPGKKGLEAAARDARYAFLRSLSGRIATAHTADDNAETVLLHLIRGTGLKGLGGIAPVSGNVIRPMLTVTRADVEDFLEEWCLHHIEDSSNGSDAFLRNRIRHRIMPLLKEENPRIGENLSAMALRLRLDEDALSAGAEYEVLPDVKTLKAMHPAVRSRCLERFLKESGVREPEQTHIRAAEMLLLSEKPSAEAHFPGGITIARNYDRLEKREASQSQEEKVLPCPGEVTFGRWRIVCIEGDTPGETGFSVSPQGTITVGPRRPGDEIRLPGGRKSLKKLYIDRKIPASRREFVPVVRDTGGILAVAGIGPNLDRPAREFPRVTIRFEEKAE